MKEEPGRDDLLSRIAELEEERARLKGELETLRGDLHHGETAAGTWVEEGDFSFGTLFDIDEIQLLQDRFARAMKVASLTTAPDGTPLTKPSNFCRLCGDIVRATPRGERNCLWFNSSFGEKPSDGPTLMCCINSGLWHAGAPVIVKGRHIANWLIGQVRDESGKEDSIRRFAARTGADEEELAEAFGEVPAMDPEDFRRIGELLFTLARQISESAFENYLKKQSIEKDRLIKQRLVKSEAYLKTVLSSIPYPLWLKDREGRYLGCNPSFEDLLGIGKEKIIGRKDREIREDLGKMPLPGLKLSASPDGRSSRVETEMEYQKDGRREWAEVIHTPICGEDGLFMGTLGMGRDISEEKRREEERQANIRFFRELDRINSILQKNRSIHEVVSDILESLLDIFGADRACVIRPDADASGNWVVPYEAHRPGKSAPGIAGRVFPPSPETGDFFRSVTESGEVDEWGGHARPPLPWYAPGECPFILSLAALPFTEYQGLIIIEKQGESSPWTKGEKDLFLAVCRRVADALSNYIMNQDIQENERFLSDVFESIPHMIFVKDAKDLKFLRFNMAGEKLLGYSKETFIGKGDGDFFTEDQAAAFNREDRKVLASRKMSTIEREYIKDAWGAERILHTKKVPILDKDGEPKYLFGISEDITEKIRMEEDLRKTTLWLDSFMDSIDDGFIILDRDSRIVHINRTVLNYYLPPGMAKEDLIGRELDWLLEQLPPLSSPRYGRFFFDLRKRVLETGESFESEIFEAGESSSAYFYTRLIPVIDGFAIVSRDITENVKAERRIMETNLRLASFMNSSDYLMGLFDEESRLLILNDKARSYLPSGERYDDVVGRELDWFARCLGDEGEMKQKILLLKESLRPVQYELQTRIGDKTTWHSYRFFRSGEEYGFIISDISEMKLLEEQLLQVQKIESIGRLAGGVAHDFNNMLSIIMGHTELALTQPDDQYGVTLHLGKVMEAAKRSSQLTGQLLAFARKQNISPQIIDLNKTIIKMTDILKSLIGEQIELNTNLAEDIHPIEIDPGQMDQIVANLCVNARDAIMDNGIISLNTENIRIDETFCSFHAEYVPGIYTVLSVSDSGKGMDRLTKEKIFEPFFTTKEVGKGTGLGLSTVYGIMKQNGGFIDVFSEREVGTTIKLFFPASAGETEEREHEAVPQGNGSETLLLIEDEKMILTMTSDMLRLYGYRVLAAENALRAREIAGETSRIDLILSDVIMPEVSGKDLVEEIRSSHPGAASIFMSGYTADIIARHGMLDRGIHFIQKPFTRLSLAGKVRQVLDSEGHKS